MWYAAVCGGSCGQKHSLSFAGNDFPAGTGSIFYVYDCLHCNSEGGIQQVFSALSTPQKLGDCKQCVLPLYASCPCKICSFSASSSREATGVKT